MHFYFDYTLVTLILLLRFGRLQVKSSVLQGISARKDSKLKHCQVSGIQQWFSHVFGGGLCPAAVSKDGGEAL